LEAQVDHFYLGNGTILDGIYKLSEERLLINFGFEKILKNKLADAELTYPRITAVLDNKSVREILDALGRADTHYNWSVDGGTINVYPRTTAIELTIRDYLRHSNLHVTNKYLQATPQSKRLAQGKLVDAILPGGLLSVNKSTLIQ
jgi:hypothetical protein